MHPSITSGLVAAAEIGANRLLALDPDVIALCAELQGQVLCVEVTDLELKLYCHPGSWGIRLSLQEPAKPVGASISGGLFALIDLALEEDKISSAIQGRVRIQGDAALARRMQKILAELEIDWEEALAQHCGDILAHQIHKRGKATGAWLRDSAWSLLQTSSEFAREEQHLSPNQVEFERFAEQVGELKLDLDRSEARLRQLLLAAAQRADQ